MNGDVGAGPALLEVRGLGSFQENRDCSQSRKSGASIKKRQDKTR